MIEFCMEDRSRYFASTVKYLHYQAFRCMFIIFTSIYVWNIPMYLFIICYMQYYSYAIKNKDCRYTLTFMYPCKLTMYNIMHTACECVTRIMTNRTGVLSFYET